tara:strand:+ start:1376 stop:1756 length:381 start_codon:yes stop_codon:yes gene_type:complete
MKSRNELLEQVGREIIEEGINLEREWNFGDVNGKRCVIEENFAKARSGRYDGVDGYYFRRADSDEFDGDEIQTIVDILNAHGFEVIHFEPYEIEWDGDRAWSASVSFVKKSEDLAVGSLKRLIGWD